MSFIFPFGHLFKEGVVVRDVGSVRVVNALLLPEGLLQHQRLGLEINGRQFHVLPFGVYLAVILHLPHI